MIFQRRPLSCIGRMLPGSLYVWRIHWDRQVRVEEMGVTSNSNWAVVVGGQCYCAIFSDDCHGGFQDPCNCGVTIMSRIQQ